MKDIIIASANKKAAEQLRRILQKDSLYVSALCTSGAEVLSYSSIRPAAVVVCGKLSDSMSASALADMLPIGFDIVRLAAPGQAPCGFVSNLVTLMKPLNLPELLQTVRSLALTQSSAGQEEQHKVVEQAKKILMEKYAVSEQTAHSTLQKKSMESGKRLVQVAGQIIREEAVHALK